MKNLFGIEYFLPLPAGNKESELICLWSRRW